MSDDPNKKIRHDLRTPINQILGYSELLEEQAQDEGDASYIPDLQKIQLAARRLLELIEAHFGATAVPAGSGPAAGAEDGGREPRPGLAPESPRAAEAAAGGTATRAAGSAARSTETLPPVARPTQTLPPLAPPNSAIRDAGSGRVLVVDDNEMNRDMLARRLASRGYAVETAEDGTRALERLERGDVDLVLLDVMMPGLSGLDVLREVRLSQSPARLPVIMATARDASEDIVAALKAGANDYVTKPLDFPVVLARVQSQLYVKHAADRIQRLAEDLEVRNTFIRNTFGRYLSDEIVQSILETPEGLSLGGERRTVTIMMADLRGFTAIAERLPPEQVVQLLNTFLGRMADAIMEHRGTIDEFIGDAILAIFGAPMLRPDDARRAVSCAAVMQCAMDEVNAWNAAHGLPAVEMGVALHTGEVVVGNIGSQKRAKYGVVGTTVNLTARIESYTVGGQVLISDDTLRAAGPDVRVAGQMVVRAKGAREPLVAWELQGVSGAGEVWIPIRSETFEPLAHEVPVRFSVVEGKHVGEEVAEGALVSLSERGADLRSEAALEPLTNLRVHLFSGGAQVPGDLYAKLVEGAPAGCLRLRFTSMPPEVDILLRRLRAGSA